MVLDAIAHIRWRISPNASTEFNTQYNQLNRMCILLCFLFENHHSAHIRTHLSMCSWGRNPSANGTYRYYTEICETANRKSERSYCLCILQASACLLTCWRMRVCVSMSVYVCMCVSECRLCSECDECVSKFENRNTDDTAEFMWFE